MVETVPAPLVWPRKKRLVVCIVLTTLNVFYFVMFSLFFVVMRITENFEVMHDTMHVLIFLMALPLYLGFLITPFLLISSILYAIIRRRHLPSAIIPIASFVSLALLFCIMFLAADRISDAIAVAMLEKDGAAFVNMVKSGELQPDDYGRVHLPEEFRHLSFSDYAVVGYTDDDSLCVAFDRTFVILANRKAFLYSEKEPKADDCIDNLYQIELVMSIIPYWYLVIESNYE